MEPDKPKFLSYRRAQFVTQLPVDYLFSPAHAWVAARGERIWRVGLTRFATRMLGEMVDHGFEATPGLELQVGQIIGWVEGFKAISDLFCVVQGQFIGSNPVLSERIELVSRDPYGAGWLYEASGSPDPGCMDVHAYQQLLDQTIDRILEKQRAGDESGSDPPTAGTPL